MFEHEEDPPDSEGQIFNIYIFFLTKDRNHIKNAKKYLNDCGFKIFEISG